MTKTVPAVKARQQFGRLLDEVDLTKTSVVVERDGKAKATVVPLGDHQLLQQLREQARLELTAQAERNAALVEAEGKTFEEVEQGIISLIRQDRSRQPR